MAAGLNNCQVIEAIQNLPPELREIIYKHYLTIKLKEREVLGWNEVHFHFLYNLSVRKGSEFSYISDFLNPVLFACLKFENEPLRIR